MDIRLHHLSIGYRRGPVVARDINITILGGRLTCLIGDNGIGKSTLLRTLSGFQPKVGGEIWLGSREADSLSQRERSRIISIVLTQRPEMGGLTVHDLVGMGRSPYTGFWGNLAARDELARALAQETPIILLDEPTAFLDFHSRIDTLRLLSRLAHTMGKTILLSTHDLQLAAELADLLLLLSPDGLRPVDPATISQDIRQRIQD